MIRKHVMSAVAVLSLFAVVPFASAATITQTQTFSFVPDGSTPLFFNQYNGNLSDLVSVHVSVVFNKTGGQIQVDNDSNESGAISVSQGATGNLNSTDVALLKAGDVVNVGASLSATDGTSSSLQGTTGDPTDEFNVTNNVDYFQWTAGNASDNDAGFINSGLWTAGATGYIGNGTYAINLSATQYANASGLGGLATATSPSTVSGSVTVVYEAIPEPASLILMGLGSVAVLGRRRRNA